MALEDISKKTYEVLEEACNSCKSNLISLSGGLDSSIIAHFLKEKNPKSVAVVSEDFVSTDLTYCQMVSKEMKIPLSIYNVPTSIILDAIDNTVKILKNFNDIEIRNNVVMYLSMKWAKEHNEKSIITGDGADELFAGYKFLINKPEKELEKEIKRLAIRARDGEITVDEMTGGTFTITNGGIFGSLLSTPILNPPRRRWRLGQGISGSC